MSIWHVDLKIPEYEAFIYALFKAFRLNVFFMMLTRGYVGADPAAGDYHVGGVGACVDIIDIIDMCRYV